MIIRCNLCLVCFFICMSICLRCYQKRMAICLILSTFLSFWLFLSSSLSSFTLLLKINYILIFEDSENHFRNRDFRFFMLIATLKTRFHSMRSFIFHGQLNIYTFWFINAIYGKIFSYLLWKIKSSRLLSWYSDRFIINYASN